MAIDKLTFKKLTEDQKNKIISTYNEENDKTWESKAFELGKEFGVSERTIRKWASEKLGLKEKDTVEPPQYLAAK